MTALEPIRPFTERPRTREPSRAGGGLEDHNRAAPTASGARPTALGDVAGDDPRSVYVLRQEMVFSGGTHGGEIFFACSSDGGRTFYAALGRAWQPRPRAGPER